MIPDYERNGHFYIRIGERHLLHVRRSYHKSAYHQVYGAVIEEIGRVFIFCKDKLDLQTQLTGKLVHQFHV